MIGQFSRLYITVRPVKLKGLWLKPLEEYNELKHMKILLGGVHLNSQTLVFHQETLHLRCLRMFFYI